VFKVLGNAIGNASLEMGPDEFIGVEFRRISREVNGLDPRIVSMESCNKLGPVERASVPKEDDLSFEVTREVPKELADLSGPDVFVGVKACVEPEAFFSGRDRNGGDGRDFGPASGDPKGWCFSFDRPGFWDVGDKRESALIQETQAGSKPNGLFSKAGRPDADVFRVSWGRHEVSLYPPRLPL